MNLLYRKRGRRYVPVGPEFAGFPADGIWLVEKNTSSWRIFMHLGDLPEPAVMTVAALQRRQGDIIAVLRDFRGQTHSMNDVADELIRVLAQEAKC